MLMNTNLASHSGLMVAAIIHKIVCENWFENTDLKKLIENLCNESDQQTKDRENLLKVNKYALPKDDKST